MTQVTIQGVTQGTSLSKYTMSQATTPNRLSYNLVGTTGTFTATAVSSNANDTAAGGGARSLQVFGLDSSGKLATSTVNLNGTTPVSLGTWKFIHSARVASVGTNLVASNLGQIAIVTGGATILTIAVNANRSADAIYRVPTGASLRLTNIMWQNTGTAEDTSTRIELYTYHPTNQPFARMELELMPRMGGQAMPLNQVLVPDTILELVNYRWGGSSMSLSAYITGVLESY